jgi:hypothetical protein
MELAFQFEDELKALSEFAGAMDEADFNEADMDDEVDEDAEEEVAPTHPFEEFRSMVDSSAKLGCTEKPLCSAGTKAKTRPGYKPAYNGCGAEGTGFFAKTIRKVLDNLPKDFVDCCNTHDICYGTCQFDAKFTGSSHRSSCDRTFSKCLGDAVRKIKQKSFFRRTPDERKCVLFSLDDVFYTAVHSLGCGPYLRGQQKACGPCK